MSVMSLFLEGVSIFHVMCLPFALFDFCVFIPSSRAFYVLLKGRRDEAFYHSSRREYLEKRRITNRFFYTQIFSYLGILLIILNSTPLFFYSLIDILYSPSFFENISFGYFPKFYLPGSKFSSKIFHIWYDIQTISFILLQVYIFLVLFSCFCGYFVEFVCQKKEIQSRE